MAFLPHFGVENILENIGRTLRSKKLGYKNK